MDRDGVVNQEYFGRRPSSRTHSRSFALSFSSFSQARRCADDVPRNHTAKGSWREEVCMTRIVALRNFEYHLEGREFKTSPPMAAGCKYHRSRRQLRFLPSIHPCRSTSGHPCERFQADSSFENAPPPEAGLEISILKLIRCSLPVPRLRDSGCARQSSTCKLLS